jgi:hypothetical protein
MRVMPLILSILLLGAAPADVPVGQFREWLSFKKQSLDFTSDGVTVHVAPLPCPAKPVGDTSCRWDGFNNQGSVTVSAPGIQPLTVTTDRQSDYARIAVVRFEPHDQRPGVIVESQYGGSGGELTVQLLLPVGDGYRAVPMVRRGGGILEGQTADFPIDRSGDGRVDLILEDAAFDTTFGCNACTPRPPRIFAVIRSVPTDESDDPALRGVFAADMARLAPGCLSNTSGRNGTCAAYVADAARVGQFAAAWAAMLRHYEHGMDVRQFCDSYLPTAHACKPGHETHYRDFPESLRAFLIRAGYLPRHEGTASAS